MSKYITRTLVRVPAVTLVTVMMFGLVAHENSDTARAVTRTSVTFQVVPQAAVTAAATPKRLKAFSYALRQHYEPYRYGAAGPNSWDCSGLVMKSYKAAGISLPRTTYDMLRSSKLRRVSRSYALKHKGTLAFHGSGHVELVSSYRYMYGAHHTGTRVTYRSWYDLGGWRFYRVVGAG